MTYRILAGVDGSACSRAALRWAVGEARARAGELTALYVWQLPLVEFPGAFDLSELELDAENFLTGVVADEAPEPGLPLYSVVAEGDPAEALILAAKAADLVVLGNHASTHLRDLLPGSVRVACAARCACPVVLVKPASQGTAAGDPSGPGNTAGHPSGPRAGAARPARGPGSGRGC